MQAWQELTVMSRQMMARDCEQGVSHTLHQLTWKTHDDDSAPEAWDLGSATLFPAAHRPAWSVSTGSASTDPRSSRRLPPLAHGSFAPLYNSRLF
jgi:hypothetical protein